VVEEDAAERRRDHGAETVFPQRLGGILTRGAAAEVAVGQQDRRPLPRLLIEDEIRVRLTVADIAKPCEQARPAAFFSRADQLWPGDDLICVDIDAHEGQRNAGDPGEAFHAALLSRRCCGHPRCDRQSPMRQRSRGSRDGFSSEALAGLRSYGWWC